MTNKKRKRKRVRLGFAKTGRGRPKAEGARYPSGELVRRPATPNPVVLESRRHALGDSGADLSAAEDPMVLAFSRRWLTEAELRAGDGFAATYAANHPARRVAPAYEAPDRAYRDPRTIAQLSDGEIVEAFDSMMDSTSRSTMSEARQRAASERYRRMCLALTALEHHEIFAAFVRRDWPQWLTWEIAGRFQTAESLRRRAALKSGLRVLAHLPARALTRPREPVGS